MSGEQMYAEPTAYYALNADELSKLQKEAADLRAQLESKTQVPWAQRHRMESRLEDLEARIQSARLAEKAGQKPLKNTSDPAPDAEQVKCIALGPEGPHEVTILRPRTRAANEQQPPAAEQQYMEPLQP